MDAVFGFGVLHHIPDWQGALTEIVRVLKPGASYAFAGLTLRDVLENKRIGVIGIAVKR